MRPAPRFEIVPPGVRLADAYGPPLDGMAEGDLLALWLRRRGAARDARLAAGRLLERFGGLAAIVAADAPELARTPGVDAAFVADLKVLRELCVRLVRSEVGDGAGPPASGGEVATALRNLGAPASGLTRSASAERVSSCHLGRMADSD